MIQEQIYNCFERNENMHVLFIFDKMDIMATELVDATWKPGYRYEKFDGRWFTTKYNIHNEWKDDKVVLIFPADSQISYPETEDTRRNFPLMGELEAGGVFHGENSLDFMSQHQIDQKYRTYINSFINELSISRVETMLAPYYQNRAFTPEVADKAIVSYMIDSARLLEWNEIILRILLMGCEAEKKHRSVAFNRLGKRPPIKNLVQAKLKDIFGEGYNDSNSETKVDKLVKIWKYNLIARSLDVKDSDDYRELKIKNSLSADRMQTLLSLAQSQPAYADKLKSLMAELGNAVREEKIIECYGIDAPYSYMSEDMCVSIIEKTLQDGISDDPQQVVERIESLLLRQPTNDRVGVLSSFVMLAANYYDLASKVSSKLKIDTPDQYVTEYTENFYKLDTFYRRALEKYYEISMTGEHILDTLTNAKQRLNANYHELIGIMGMEWTRTVADTGMGWKFTTGLVRQPDFYNQYVKNSNVRTMVIVSDALRYEVAKEILGEMYKRSKQKHEMRLEPMIGMLPSETNYSKLSLLPHSTLSFVAEGTSLDGGPYLGDIKAREAHLQHYNPDAFCFNYGDLVGDTKVIREKLKGMKLCYVFHDVIDDAGHGDDGASVVSACRRAINELSEFILRAMATYNFEQVYCTSDHGFLFNDIKIQDNDKQTITEDCTEKKSRYYLTSSDAEVMNVVKYDGVAVPIGTNRFAAPGATYRFAHGGSSLQETVIPLIMTSRGREHVGEQQKVSIMLLSDKLVIQSSRLSFTLVQREAVSYDMKKIRIRFALYEGDNIVSEEKELDINKADADASSRLYSQSLTLNGGNTVSLLELRIYDVEDTLNPLIKATVTNKTLVERDF